MCIIPILYFQVKIYNLGGCGCEVKEIGTANIVSIKISKYRRRLFQNLVISFLEDLSVVSSFKKGSYFGIDVFL